MSLREITVQVEGNTYDLCQAIKNLLMTLNHGHEAHLSTASQIQEIAHNNLKPLYESIKNIKEVKAEAHENMEAFLKSWSLTGAEIFSLFYHPAFTEVKKVEVKTVTTEIIHK